MLLAMLRRVADNNNKGASTTAARAPTRGKLPRLRKGGTILLETHITHPSLFGAALGLVCEEVGTKKGDPGPGPSPLLLAPASGMGSPPPRPLLPPEQTEGIKDREGAVRAIRDACGGSYRLVAAYSDFTSRPRFVELELLR